MIKHLNFILKTTWLIIGILLLAACSNSKSPVLVRETVSRNIESESLGGRVITIIQPGDTWHGIAFANNLTTAELAKWNNMSDQDALRVGQRLRLTKPLGFKQNSQTSSPSLVKVPANTADKVEVVPVEPVSESTNSIPVSPEPPESLVIKTPKQPQLPLQFDQKNLRWVWPLQGEVVNKFSPNQGRKGIDIRGEQNQAVRVAAPGKVVYQGNGVKGYRNLIIVKHNEDLLSAYAHNEQVYVKEGQWVSENQTISTVGLKEGQPVLHFEIRRKGKPVDPLQYIGG